jgi:hypothetical protein
MEESRPWRKIEVEAGAICGNDIWVLVVEVKVQTVSGA